MALLFLPWVAFSQANPWYQTDFPPEEFKARWGKIFEKIGDKAVAVLQGVSQTNGFIMPRQTNDFYYLCGIETPHSYLLLDGRQKKVTLFLPPRNPRLESAEGKVLSAEDSDLVKQLTGVDEVASTEAMRSDFLRPTGGGPPLTIYAPFSPAEGSAQSRYELLSANTAILNDYWDGRLPREGRFVELLRQRYPRARIEDLTPIVDEMRSLKSTREIALIRRASQIAGLGIMEAMRSTKPGLYEYHLDAAARYVFLVNGARLEGYRSIVAAGVPNIWNMHYYRDMSPLARRRHGVDGFRAGIPLLHQRCYPHVAHQRQVQSLAARVAGLRARVSERGDEADPSGTDIAADFGTVQGSHGTGLRSLEILQAGLRESRARAGGPRRRRSLASGWHGSAR